MLYEPNLVPKFLLYLHEMTQYWSAILIISLSLLIKYML